MKTNYIKQLNVSGDPIGGVEGLVGWGGGLVGWWVGVGGRGGPTNARCSVASGPAHQSGR